MSQLGRVGVVALWAVFGGMEVARAENVAYTFHFETQAIGFPTPRGGFIYDASTGIFSDFVVQLRDEFFDFTAKANQFNGRRRIPFELGTLGQNLIDGYGPLGPELSRWYAGVNGFYGFEWRTPAFDFLYFDLTTGAPSDPISSSPRAFSGTWRTTAAAPAAVPEPGAGSLLVTAAGLGFAAVMTRRRRRSNFAN